FGLLAILTWMLYETRLMILRFGIKHCQIQGQIMKSKKNK
ncbi:hypothetical protein HMPREF0549_1422, partial [Limosilactobacillus vaginalis DSM 5837 = ATCC 49540]